ncbi:MAG: thymidine phosphorylase [Deltaproteobacteria bacterium]|nr:MAG: thymidine phosphorylase [Deltaproteobacteria bacterium]
MREGEEQSREALRFFVRGIVDGSVTRPQAAAWLAWAYSRGLTPAETAALTREMTDSGDVLTWPEGPELIDKHSTGGVGDKVSLVLAPVWAALGKRVPMISGRGLGHTGGTLDKLEAIPGFRTDLSEEELREVLASAGAFISGQTGEVAPADKVLYALRNETQTVPSTPLVCGSILSKKLAEGVHTLILDIKVGSGAFMKTLDKAQHQARTLVDTAIANGVDCTALITAMDRPLGRAVGNANEVREAIDCLKGGGPAELRELVLALARDPAAEATLDDGRALEAFQRMVEAQGGDPRVVDEPERLLGGGCTEHVVRADRTGRVTMLHALPVGRAAFDLGAGRLRAEDPVDFGVGVEILAPLGSEVKPGDALARVLHRDGHGLGNALESLNQAFVFDGPDEAFPLVIEEVTG